MVSTVHRRPEPTQKEVMMCDDLRIFMPCKRLTERYFYHAITQDVPKKISLRIVDFI